MGVCNTVCHVKRWCEMIKSDKTIRFLEPREKRYTVADSGGMYLEVSPNGGKWWRLRYFFEGKKYVISLGVYPEVSLKKARELRDRIRVQILEGHNPKKEREDQDEKSTLPTFSDVAEEWISVRQSEWKAGHFKTVRQRLDKYLLPSLGDKPITEIEIQDFLKILRAVETAGKLETAHRTASIASQICKFAKLSGLIKSNPAEDLVLLLKKPKVTPRAAILDKKRIGEMLYKIQYYYGKPITTFCLRIMPYVFVRSIELRGARWDEIDFEKKIWIIPAERMKMGRAHIVPLPTQVINLFEELKIFSGNCSLCFPGDRYKDKMLSDATLLCALRNLGYAKMEMCVHGFRSIASTILNEKGYRPDIIEMQLAHVDKNQVRAAYNRAEYIEERAKMMQEYADYLDSLKNSALNL